MKNGNQPLGIKDLSAFDRLVVIDFEGTGKRVPTPDEMRVAPVGFRPPGSIIEIGAVELLRQDDRWEKGRTYHTMVNPEGPVERRAIQIHGIHETRLKDAPRFAEVFEPFSRFIGSAGIIAHAYENERLYLDYEFARLGRTNWGDEAYPIGRWLCTQRAFARQFNQTSKSLDVVCDKLWLDRSERDFHGALLDADLTADVLVMLELMALHGYDVETARGLSLGLTALC
ncbi:exonuclease, DNA polymerase III, epsilon subunit family domain protein (plasmid) [Bosea sp. RAC05]|nr:exonuclease, DNA polymerase III, epsilon subunit family domain protein [Bosea sp. RAC05]